MAHTCTHYVDSAYGRDIYIIKAKASDVKLISLISASKPQGVTVNKSGHYGMNASWFEGGESNDQEYNCILNIAYQDGVPLSIDGHGTINEVGDCLIYYKNKMLYYAEGVTSSNDSRVPKSSGTWAQGGMGLYLCDPDWLTRFKAQPSKAEDYTKGSSARTAMIVNLHSLDVYLFACPTLSADLASFRETIMTYFGLREGNNNPYWKAIMLDGGGSVELYGTDFYAHNVVHRKVPQMISVGPAN